MVTTALVGLLGTILGGGITLSGQWFMASRQEKNQFRLAALDKRLQVHQEAYTRWHEMLRVIDEQDQLGQATVRSQEWWFQNCLYLDPAVRKEFFWCTQDVFGYAKDETMRKEVWTRITGLGDVIAAAVDLPSIGDPETVAQKMGAKSLRA